MTAAKEPTEQESELLHNSIYETLRNHRLSHQFTGEGDSYPLIDALTPSFKTVDIGDDEIKRLADELYDNLNTSVSVILSERSKALGDPNGSFDKCMQAISDRDTEARKADALTKMLVDLMKSTSEIEAPPESLLKQMGAINASGLI